ncbi:ATP-binding protein [Methylobacterium sp. NFXW15]|uniref:ATP-binding protein n=1 Tax=Methylobacterium sp. NFXW15 TaxID=2819512 RepID=UPI003CEC66C9
MIDDPRRPAAWSGAAITGGAFITFLLWEGSLGVAGAFAGLGAIVLGGLIAGRRRTLPPTRPVAGTPRHAVAEALLAHIPDPVILVDRRTRVLEANPAARALLPTLHLSHPLAFALRDPEITDAVEAVLNGGPTQRVAYEIRVPLERSFEIQVGGLQVPDGSGAGAVLFLRDLTSAHRLEAMRVDFIANASHELRTPLSSLLGFIETLQGPARDDVAAHEKFLEIMRVQAQRMRRLIDDLLSLSRIELREHVAPTTVVDLGALARQMVEAQAPLAAARDASVTLIEDGGPFRVQGDADELTRVIENLIANAVKYGGGEIRVGLTREEESRHGPQIVLTVCDEGPGIAPEHIPRLTERFYRVDVASSRARGGTGLGLAIVKHSLRRHRGRLTIESEVGQGTTARVSLPEYRAGLGRT